jgi:hypothetical protein
MKVLIISSNTLPAAPTGPVYVAGAVREAGHEVQIYERLGANDLERELTTRLEPKPGLEILSQPIQQAHFYARKLKTR